MTIKGHFTRNRCTARGDIERDRCPKHYSTVVVHAEHAETKIFGSQTLRTGFSDPSVPTTQVHDCSMHTNPQESKCIPTAWKGLGPALRSTAKGSQLPGYIKGDSLSVLACVNEDEKGKGRIKPAFSLRALPAACSLAVCAFHWRPVCAG